MLPHPVLRCETSTQDCGLINKTDWCDEEIRWRVDEQLNSHELFAQLAVTDIPLQVWIGFPQSPQSPHSFILSTSIWTSIVSLLVHTQRDYKLLEEDLELLRNPDKQSVKSCLADATPSLFLDHFSRYVRIIVKHLSWILVLQYSFYFYSQGHRQPLKILFLFIRLTIQHLY